MAWADDVVEGLRSQQVRLVVYVADKVLVPVLERIAADPGQFRLVALTREEEGVGILAGAFFGGMRGALLMQSSGFGNTLNGLGSLAIPYQVGFPMLISVRGGLGETNKAQVPVGRAIPEILAALGIPRYDLDRPEAVAGITRGAARQAFATGRPVALLLSSLLTGGKGGGF
jgi:sulfopyruvate decarboxylase alpha subunit